MRLLRRRTDLTPRGLEVVLRGLWVATVLFAGALWVRPGFAEEGTEPPFLVRELYVPFEYFRELTRNQPDGLIIEISEYRELVRAAIAKQSPAPEGETAPVEAVVTHVAYRGDFVDGNARITADVRVESTTDDWAVCSLGPQLGATGSILVDGEPGWAVLDSKGQLATVIRGKGRHKVTLRFNVDVSETDDQLVLQTPLLASPAGFAVIDVPGVAEGTSVPDTLSTERDEGRTRFRVVLGNAARLQLKWRRTWSLDENPVHLDAAHALTFLPRTEGSLFKWNATTLVSRRKVEELAFREPPGATVVDVGGALLHSWERRNGQIWVTLQEPTRGRVDLEFWGSLALNDGAFELGPPELVGAYVNRGTLALLRRAREPSEVTSTAAVRELDPRSVRGPELSWPGTATPVAGSIGRVFEFTSSDARVRGVTLVDELAFETRSSFVARVRETRFELPGFVQIQLESGRAYSFVMTLPEGARLKSVKPVGEAYQDLHHDLEGNVLRLRTRQAVVPERPLGLQLDLEMADFGADRDWTQKDLSWSLPRVVGAERTRTDVAVSIQDSLMVAQGDFTAWRSLSPEERLKVGVFKAARLVRQSDERLAASLTSEAEAPSLELRVRNRVTRGEYRAVTHVLAAERAPATQPDLHTVRVRCDLRLAVVDRAVDELVFRHPALPESALVVVLGEGIQEVVPDLAAGTQTVRFAQPWLGTRQFRIEFEVANRPDEERQFPSIDVAGDWGRERFIVLQSQGSTEVVYAPGSGVATVEMDDVPDFAEPWRSGRSLGALRVRGPGELGTWRAILHQRAPVLGRLAHEMNLTTVLDRSGVERHRAEVFLAYAREQSLRIVLPAGARVIGATVDGVAIRELRAENTSDSPAFAIPLPPRSFATVTVIYETRGNAFGSWGSRRLSGPVLQGIPVAETNWEVLHPDGYRSYVVDGNVQSLEPGYDERIRSFAGATLGRILSGRLPRFQIFWQPRVVRAFNESGDVTAAFAKGPSVGRQSSTLSPRGVERQVERAPRMQLQGTGRRIALTKVGGQPEVSISYHTFAWESFSKWFVFLGTLLVAFVLARRGLKTVLWQGVALGLFFGSLVPVALNWESPFLLIPFCEALIVLILWCCLLPLLRRAGGSIRARWIRGSALGATAALVLAISPALFAQDNENLPPFDQVLIPYSEDPADWKDPIGKVFLSEERFRQLWELAHPDPSLKPDEERGPYDYVVGNVSYTVTVQEERYELLGEMFLYQWLDGPVRIPLPFDGVQLSTVRVDGRPVGVFQHENQASIEINGRGLHRVSVLGSGMVERDLGVYTVASDLLHGLVGSMEVRLPAGSELLSTRDGTAARVNKTDAGVTVSLDLGATQVFQVEWTRPLAEGQVTSRSESRSYTGLSLTPDGFEVAREERLRVSGQPIERVRYRVFGEWAVTELEGTEVAEWSVRTEGQARVLDVYFNNPLTAANFRVRGRAKMVDQGSVPTLELENAVRQETFLGLNHSRHRRFHAQSLAELTRKSPVDVRGIVNLPPDSAPDRIYHAHGSAAGATLRIVEAPSQVRLESEAIAFLRQERVQIFVKSTYAKASPGPLRHRVLIPEGWTVRKVQCPGLLDWEVIATDAGRELVVALEGRVSPGFSIVWSAEQDLTALPATLQLPALRFVAEDDTRVDESLLWVVAARGELDLTSDPVEAWEPMALDTLEPWVPLTALHSYRFAFRSRRPGPALAVRVALRPAYLSATVVSFARLAERHLFVNARVAYRATGVGVDEFTLRLPTGAELVFAETDGIRSQRQSRVAEGTLVSIELQDAVQGDGVLDVAYRTPRVAGGDLPAVLPLRLLSEGRPLPDVDHYVGVVQTERTVALDVAVEGLTAVERETLPFLPAAVSERVLQPTFRASQPDWRLTLGEQEIEVAEGLDAVIQLADLTTVIGTDGTVRTQVVYTLINERLQFLTIDLPTGADLWGVTVDGRPVAVGRLEVQADLQTLQIPVEQLGGPELPLEIILTYEEPAIDLPGYRETAQLRGPKIAPGQAVQVVESLWSVQFPEGYDATESAGIMRQAPPSVKNAEKLKNLLEQQEQVLEASRSYKSKHGRKRATQQLARIEQALGDNLAELEGKNRSATERDQMGLIGTGDVEKQWLENDSIIQQTQQAQTRLRSELERAQSLPDETQSADDKAFQDRANFLRRQAWRRGQAAPRREFVGRPSNVDLEVLLEKHGYGGLNEIVLTAPESGTQRSQPRPIDGKQGLKPLVDGTRTATSPALRPAGERDGFTTYTFRRGDADAELTLTLSRGGLFGRTLAWLLLILVGAGFVWLRREFR